MVHWNKSINFASHTKNWGQQGKFRITTMRTKTELSDFDFRFVSAGHYYVYYTSPNTPTLWKALVTDMELIDTTKNAEYPKRCDLDHLKRVVKTTGSKWSLKTGKRLD